MNPKVKLLILVLVSSGMLLFTNFIVITIAAVSAVALVFVFNIQDKFMPWIKPLLLAFVVIVLLQTFTYAGLSFSMLGFQYGLLFAMRIFVLLTMVFIFVQTTTMGRLAEAFDFLPRTISQVLVMALSMLPNVMELAEKIMNAQKSRGLSFRSPNITRTYFPVLVPLVAKTLERSERMALAMQARGFDDGT